MNINEQISIIVETTVNSPIEKVWEHWTLPVHIIHWNNASDEWHTPKAENDLRPGGKFLFRMESRDGRMGFDFSGEYYVVKVNEYIEYKMDDGRKVSIQFTELGNETKITETFDAETIHSPEMQKAGWQAILDNFKLYAENNI